MNALLEIIRECALPVYAVLLVLAFVSGYVSGYKKGMRDAGVSRPISSVEVLARVLSRIREYLANQDNFVPDTTRMVGVHMTAS